MNSETILNLTKLFAESSLSIEDFDKKFDKIIEPSSRRLAAMFSNHIDFESHIIKMNESTNIDDHYSEIEIECYRFLIANYKLWKRFR